MPVTSTVFKVHVHKMLAYQAVLPACKEKWLPSDLPASINNTFSKDKDKHSLPYQDYTENTKFIKNSTRFIQMTVKHHIHILLL